MPQLCVTMSQCGRGLLRASCAPDGQLIPRLPHSLWEVDQVEVAPDVTVRRALCELSAEKKADFLVAGACTPVPLLELRAHVRCLQRYNTGALCTRLNWKS
jgi:hypothetical protein